ncbi:MAG: hypothetical protein P8M71_02875 [Pseudomonadales bacterium]|nr:hypothetical protein [Pseudomonadales bacterium]
MSLEASTATPHLDAEGQYSLALESAESLASVEMPSIDHSYTSSSDQPVNSHVSRTGRLSESLWVSMSNGEQLHLRHFMPSKLTEIDKPLERIFMLHGEAECGRIFYDNSGQGLADYLATLGYEVFVADLGGRGRSLGADSHVSELTTRQIITEAIPRLLRTIELHNNETDSQNSAHLVSNKATIWIGHGFGGVLLSAAWARLSSAQRSASRMVFFGSRRRLQSPQRWARHFSKLFSHPMIAKLIDWHQAFPAKLLRLGSSDENPDWYHCYAKWMNEERWLDPEDNFDYGLALKCHPVPPTLHFAAKADTVFADIQDVRGFIDELGPHDARLLVLGDIGETTKQYDHLSMLIHPSAENEVFSFLDQWLLELAEYPLEVEEEVLNSTHCNDFPTAKPLSHSDAAEPLAAAPYLEEDNCQNEGDCPNKETIVLCA